MRIFCDTANLSEIAEWNEHPWVSGFTTNPSLVRAAHDDDMDGLGLAWAQEVVCLTDKPVSIDGPPEVWELGPNVWRKVSDAVPQHERGGGHINHTAIVHPAQIPNLGAYRPDDIISVFAGRIMDTGRSPDPAIQRARQTGAQVLWASVREPFNLFQAEAAGCDIVTVTPPILRKWLEWRGKPLEVVAEETIAQFQRDSEGLW